MLAQVNTRERLTGEDKRGATEKKKFWTIPDSFFRPHFNVSVNISKVHTLASTATINNQEAQTLR